MIKKLRQFTYRHLVLSLILLAIILNLTAYFFTPKMEPENVRITNVTDSTVSVSWTTAKPATGFVVYNQQTNKILRTFQFFCYQLPILAKYCFKTVIDEIPNPSYAHHVTLKNLTADSTYYYRVASGWKLYKNDKSGKTLPDIKTASVLETLPMPQPIFSRVFQKDGQTGAPNTLVYLALLDSTDTINSSTISTVTDSKGVWNMDLGNLRSADLKSPITFKTKNAKFLLIIQGGKFGESYSTISTNLTKPTQFVVLK